MEQVNEHTPIVFIVKNNNDFEVKNVEIFNPQGQKATEGVKIVPKYVEDGSQTLFPLQKIYDYLNEGNVMPICYVLADFLSVKVPQKITKFKKIMQDWQIDFLGDPYEIYHQKTIALALEAKVKINIRGIDNWNDALLITSTDYRRRFLRDLSGGECVIFRFDSTTKITLESIPPRTEIRYIFKNR